MIAWREIKFHAAGVDLLTPARRPSQASPSNNAIPHTCGPMRRPKRCWRNARNSNCSARRNSREGFHSVLVKPLADRVVLEAVSSALNLNLSDQQVVVQ